MRRDHRHTIEKPTEHQKTNNENGNVPSSDNQSSLNVTMLIGKAEKQASQEITTHQKTVAATAEPFKQQDQGRKRQNHRSCRAASTSSQSIPRSSVEVATTARKLFSPSPFRHGVFVRH